MPDPDKKTAGLIADAGIFFFFSAVTVLITWPMARDPAHLIADSGVNDPILNARFLRDVFDWFLGRHTGGLFDAEFFFPHPLALATTDSAIGVALTALPFTLFTGDYLTLVNLAILLTFPLTAFTAYLLGRELSGSRLAGVVAGSAFGFCMYRIHQLDHVPILQMQWLPLALYFVHRLTREPSFRNAAGLAAAAFLNGIGSMNLGLYTTPVLAIVSLWAVAVVPGKQRLRTSLALALAGAVTIAALVPFYMPFLRVDEIWGIKRSVWEVVQFAARVEQFVAAPRSNLLYGGFFAKFMGNESATFLGVTVLLLALVSLARPADGSRRGVTGVLFASAASLLLAGFVVTVLLLGTKWKVIALSTAGAGLGAWAVMTVLWRNEGENPPAISAARLYLVIGLVYGALSLGPEVIFKGHKIGDGPWMMIAGIPGYGTVRTPSRFFLVTVLSASAMASMGAAWIASAIGRPRWSTVFSLAVISLVLLEEWSSPVPVRRMPGMSEAPGAYWWMAAQHDRGVLLEVPLCPGTQYGRERMLFSNLHRHPVVDSESSFLPPVMGWLDRDRLKDGGAIPYLEKLRTIGLRYVIVHHEGVRSGEIRAIIRTLERSGATKAADFGLDEIYVYPAAGVAPGPFQKNNAAASISAGLAGDGSGLQARAALKNLTGSPIFERKARKLTVEAEIHATDGSRSVKKAGIWFAPPLFAPGETQQRRVEIEVPAATQGFGYHLRLVDESGETWAEGAGRVDGASGKGGS